MITREQVADLRPGDVVEVHDWSWPAGHMVTGPLYEGEQGSLWIAGRCIRFESGDISAGNYEDGRLTVISRAPRLLYVNHPRTEPAPGDVVRLEADCNRVVMRMDEYGWIDGAGIEWDVKRKDRPRLLVDGETGQVVP